MAEHRDSFDGAPFADELDDGEALQAAARAGILLLEQNHELQEENAALREQVAVLEQERPSLRQALEARDAELQALRDERRQAMLEANSLRNEVKAQSALVTDLLERERLLKAAAEDAEVARELAEASMDALQRRVDELRALSDNQSAELQVLRDGASNQLDDKAGDSAGDLEDVTAKWHAAVAENQALQCDLESALRDGDALRRKAAKLADCVAQIERLEKKSSKLQSANETLHEELEEERAVLESLRTMNLMYKKLADSRPFAFDEGPNGLDDPAASSHEKTAMAPLATAPGSVTLQDVLLETNLKLETEIRELKMAMNRDHPNNNEEDGDNNSSHSNDDTLKRSGSNGSLNTASNNGSEETQEDRLMRKVQSLEEKLKVAKDVIKHAKLHWSSAVASQKALEECNRDAQDEIARLTQQLDYYVSLATSQSSDATAQKEELLKKHGDDNNPPDFEEKWVEETAPYPAPPGDLNSPLIKCLLDHWTTDKSEVMMLTDWLHNAIRGTGKSTPLHLANLKSEVAAGFAQLLVPILRERHGVSVTIYRRDSLHILSDLLLQTNQSSYDVPEFTTSESESTNEEEATTPRTFKMKANSGRSGRAMRRKRGSSPFLKGETQFLYG